MQINNRYSLLLINLTYHRLLIRVRPIKKFFRIIFYFLAGNLDRFIPGSGKQYKIAAGFVTIKHHYKKKYSGMNNLKINLIVLQQKLAVCRLEKNSELPYWVFNNVFFSVTKTDDELSIVCSEDIVPENIKAEKNWRAIKVNGPLDFSLTGVLSSIINPLADAGIGIFAISTYDTDYILIKEEYFEKALNILENFHNIIR